MASAAARFESDERFAFYRDRALNHEKSLHFAEEQRTKALALHEASMSVGGGQSAVNPSDFILTAAETLISSRRVLMWTYIWAFFETDIGVRELFEHSQGELEKFTERLSALTEGKTAEQVLEHKNDIISLNSVLLKFLGALEFYTRPGGERPPPSAKQKPVVSSKRGNSPKDVSAAAEEADTSGGQKREQKGEAR